MLKNIRRIITLITIGLLGTIILLITDTVLNFGARLKEIHPYLEIGFFVLVAGLVLYCLVIPIVRIILLPKYKPLPDDSEDKEYLNHLCKLKGELANSAVLVKNEQAIVSNLVQCPNEKVALEKEIDIAISAINKKANIRIYETAASVGVMTALSQSGRFDAIIVLLSNIRMTNEIIKLYKKRPTFTELLKIYGIAGSAAFLAEQIDDMDFGDSLVEGIGAAGGTALTNVPFAGKTIECVTQGIFNGFFTMRIGHAVKNACGAKTAKEFNNAKSAGRIEALKSMPKFGKMILLKAKNQVLKIGGDMGKKLGGIFDSTLNKVSFGLLKKKSKEAEDIND